MGYKFDPVARAYWDEATRRFVPNSHMIQMRESIVTAAASEAAAVTERFVSGEINRDNWIVQFREVVKDATEAQFVLARGGEKQMTPEDWSIVDARLLSQDKYISRFADEIQAGMSVDAATNRAMLYAETSRSAFEQGRSRSWTDVRLPAYPGDGNTECVARCKCRWDYRTVGEELHATWKLEPGAKHCGGCSANAMMYNPYIVSLA